MKSIYIITTTFLLIAFGSICQTGIAWDPESIVSDGSIYGNIRPRATMVNDIPVVVYAGFGDENLFISRWNGSGFDTQSVLPPGTSTYAATWTGPDIASKGDTVIAVFKLKPAESGNVYVVRSVDGGVTFSDTIRVGSYTGGNHWLPSIEMDDNGNPTVAIMIHDGSWANPRQALFQSNDGGLTFGPALEVTTPIPGEACDCCPSEVVIDGSREMLLFRNNENNIRDVHGVLSVDDGQTFPYTENVDQLDWNISQCPASGMDGLFEGNNFYTTFASNASGTYQVYVSRSDVNGGLNMTEIVNVPTPSGGQNYPTISGANDTILLAWEERIGTNKDIYYSVSTNGGVNALANLSAMKLRANEITVANQTNPHILYKNGMAHLFYQDDANGNVMYRRGSVQSVAGLTSLELSPISVYPNPTQGNETFVTEAVNVQGVFTPDGRQIPFSTISENDGVALQFETSYTGIVLIHCTDSKGNSRTLRCTKTVD
ncbi:MAG: glycoside hydrolase [bacterium]|nr:glycoside hydrolase [bacterium]